MGTKLCNEGGATCDEGTDLGLAFSTSSVAYAKCQLGEHTNNHMLGGFNFETMHLLCYVFQNRHVLVLRMIRQQKCGP